MGGGKTRRAVASALALVFAVLVSCSGEESAPPTSLVPPTPPAIPVRVESRTGPANLILIVVDSLRADHLGAYGYARPTTPFVDRLADEGLVFLDARSPSSFTRESIASLFTGRLPSPAGSTGWRARPHPDLPTLAERLSGHGYRTGFFVATAVLSGEAFSRGFDSAVRPNARWDTSGGSRDLTERGIRWIDQDRAESFFLYLHYLDPHGPYEPPDDLADRFARTRSRPGLHLYRQILSRLPALIDDGLAPGDPRFEDLVDRYDAEIADVDRSIRLLYEALEQRGLAQDSWIALTADHGEEFLEHGSFEHAWTLYEESIRIPLIVWAPGRVRPGRIEGAASLIDLAPTLLHGLGLERLEQGPGRSLLAVEGSGLVGRASGTSHTGELLIGHRNVLRTRIDGAFKYIEVLRWEAPGERRFGNKEARAAGERFDVRGEVIRRELYHLGDDPGERRNVLDEHPEIAARLQEALARETRARAAAPVADAAEVLRPDEAARLRALGYIEDES